MTPKRKVKSTSHIQQTPKTKGFSTKNQTPNSSIPSSTATNNQNCMSAEVSLEEQQKSIDYLRKKVELLEGKISELESQIHITQTVNSLLQTKIDNQEQYSRRPCLVIKGLGEPGDEDEIQKIAATIEEEASISRNTAIKNLDRTHPISQVDDAGNQKKNCEIHIR